MAINRPVLGVSTLVRHRGRTLLVRRGRPPLAGSWALPGGRVEIGEALAAAAIREVREETGVTVHDLRRIDLAEIIQADGAGGVALHFVLVVFQAEFQSGVPAAGDDAAEARWVDAAEMPALMLTEDTKRIIASHA